MKKKNNEKINKIIKIVLLVILLIAMVIITIKIYPYFADLSTEEGRMALKDKITSLGVGGAFLIIGLTVAQIFFAFLPGEPVEILSGMCFGPIGGLFVIYIGDFISTLLIILLVRTLGRSFIYNLVSKEKLDKLENSKFFKSKSLEPIFMILFALPGTPKDLLTYVGAFLPINPVRFLLIATFFRFPSIITSTIAGNSMLEGNWKFVIIVYAVTIIASLICIYFYNKNINKTEEDEKKEEQREN